MANSPTTLDLLSFSQNSKETTANALLDAASPATLYGRRASTTSGLTWGYYGGWLLINGTLTTKANGTVALTGSADNYVEATIGGTVSTNTTGFTAGRIPLYKVVTGASTVSSYEDYRLVKGANIGYLSISVAGSSNVTASAIQARNDIIKLTGVLTGNIDFVLPDAAKNYIIQNSTTGAFTVTVKTSTGTGQVLPQNAIGYGYSDGTNFIFTTGTVLAANPSASVGLTAINGSASTYMRSDAAPAISQSITPTWTGVHTFNGASTVIGGLLDLSGASAGSVKFPSTQVSRANVNTLDDYEEGSFTATVATGLTTQPTFTLYYTKIGREVHITGDAQIESSVTSDSTQLTLSGLPFAATQRSSCQLAPQRCNWTVGNQITWQLDAGDTVLKMVQIGPADATYTAVTSSAASNTPSLGWINLTYITAT
jgi:hypothetical protein